MTKVSNTNQELAKTVARAFGGTPNVSRFWDDNRKGHVDILSCAEQPQNGVTSFATVGLSDFPLFDKGTEYPVRVEFVGASGNGFPKFDNALASAAFCIINTNWFCFPGAIFPNVLGGYGYSATLPHFFFTAPFVWGKEPRTLQFRDKWERIGKGSIVTLPENEPKL